MTKTAKSQCHLPISLPPNPPMDIHGHFFMGEIKEAILNVSKLKLNERCSTSLGVPMESSSHYINKLDLILVSYESVLKNLIWKRWCHSCFAVSFFSYCKIKKRAIVFRQKIGPCMKVMLLLLQERLPSSITPCLSFSKF